MQYIYDVLGSMIIGGIILLMLSFLANLVMMLGQGRLPDSA